MARYGFIKTKEDVCNRFFPVSFCHSARSPVR